MTAQARTLLRLTCGLPPGPADADELGRIFDATPLYAPTTTHAEDTEATTTEETL